MSGEFQRWICDACGFIYDEAKGDPDSGLAPGTRYADIPEDWQCPLCGLSKSDLRLLPEVAAPNVNKSAVAGKPAAHKGGADYVVIIGAGIAGWSAAEAIRRREPKRPILLVSACKGLVYPKPALSMALALGKTADELVDADAATRAAELAIDVRTDTRVLKIDATKKRITTAKGGINYDKLILALGAHQRELPVTGNARDEIMQVNDLGTYKKFRTRLDEGVKHISILGAGLIGCEFADDLTTAGYQVSILDPKPHPLSGLVPDMLAIQLQSRLAEKGVDWRFQCTLESLVKAEHGFTATLSNGEIIQTDLVLSAAGLVANTRLAEKVGLKTDQGISVDNDMRSTNPDIYAIGDCASVNGQVFAYIEPIRRQAEAIAASIMGEHERFMPIPPLIKIKTPSLPLSICRPVNSDEREDWTMVNEQPDGCHLEIQRDDSILGFALCGDIASEAGGLYKKLQM